jgi:hypothetical protein
MRKSAMARFLWMVGVVLLTAQFAYASIIKPRQVQTLEMVKEIASKYPNKQGETFEKTAMAICLTETSAGVFKVGDIGKDPNIFNASLGVMQVRLETARFIADKLGLVEIQQMSDVQLVNRLLGDDRFNIEVAVQFLVWLNDHTGDYFRTVSRYNGGNNNHPYYQRVMRNMRLIAKETHLMDDL